MSPSMGVPVSTPAGHRAGTSAPAPFALPPPAPAVTHPGGVGWGHRVRLPVPPTQDGAPAPAPPHPRTPGSGGGGQQCKGGGRGLPQIPPTPPFPVGVSTPARVVIKSVNPDKAGREWGGSQSDVPPPPPVAPSRVSRPDAVIPPRLPQPPAGWAGIGVPAVLREGREGGQQGHILQELLQL